MTATSGAGPSAPDKTQCYEELRTRALESRDAPVGLTSVVLIRQGMSAWMQLDDEQTHDSHTRGDECAAQHRPVLPAPQQSELLTVLTSLVFTVGNHKESA